MPKVFISHSWEDNEISRKLAEYLKQDGAEIWIDYARIAGGDALPDVIGKGIEWCDIFLLVWSRAAKESYYVNLEWNCAIDNRKRIIPCILDDEKVPTILTAFLRIDFKNFDKGYNSIAHDLKLTVIEKEPKGTLKKKPKEQPETFRPKPLEPKPEKPAEPKTVIIKPKQIIFRSNPKTLSEDDVKSMVKKYDFFDNHYNQNGKGFNHHYEEKSINGDWVVIDKASALMWQKNATSFNMTFKYTKKWIAEFNRKGFASFADWRLPTMEEAISLLEPKKEGIFSYTNRIFYENCSIWTADKVQGKLLRVWVVHFRLGYCEYGWVYLEALRVRAVRSVQSSHE